MFLESKADDDLVSDSPRLMKNHGIRSTNRIIMLMLCKIGKKVNNNSLPTLTSEKFIVKKMRRNGRRGSHTIRNSKIKMKRRGKLSSVTKQY